MDIKQLHYFITILEEGSISAAASKLHISQPPLSTQLKNLEDELGVTLIERTSRSQTVTDAGQLLYNRAKNIVSLSESVKKEMVDFGNGLQGTLRIGTISSSSVTLLNHCIRDFHERYPLVRFDVTEGNTYQLIEKLKAGNIEIAVVRTPFKADEFECAYIAEEPMVAIGHKEYFSDLPQGVIPLSMLQEKPLIYYKRFDKLLTGLLQQFEHEPHIMCANEDARTTLLWSNAGLGIALVPQSISTILHDDSLDRRILSNPELCTRMAAIWKKDQYISNIAKKFIAVFSEIRD